MDQCKFTDPHLESAAKQGFGVKPKAQTAAEGNARLLRLAEELDALAERGVPVNMEQWVSDAKSPGDQCSTAGCAMWYAARVPEFRALKLEIGGGQPWLDDLYYGFSACQRMFHLTGDEARWLFLASTYDRAFAADAAGHWDTPGWRPPLAGDHAEDTAKVPAGLIAARIRALVARRKGG